jgi:AAA15 family ATPase/GTPase
LKFFCNYGDNYGGSAMLLEFRVRNFRSFREEVVLSLVASKDQSLRIRNTFDSSLPTPLRLNRSAVIYGANASGKTNLLRALGFMVGVVQQSAGLLPNQQFMFQPFKLDANSGASPSLFEVTLLLNGRRFQYGFELTATRIVAEWLLVYEKSKAQTWFERKTEDEKDTYKFSSHLTGPKKVWQEATRPNALFLSTAVQLNSEALAPLHTWLSTAVNVFLDGGFIPFEFSTNMVGTAEGHQRIRSMMTAADIAIDAITTRATKGLRQQFSVDLASGKTSAQTEEAEILLPTFRHKSGRFTADIDISDESQGTQKLFSLAGPMFDILSKGTLFAIDELDRSMHPLLVRKIVETFHDPTLNCNGAQLIFTTHDTSLLDSALFRRDQIWFTEKQTDQSSSLASLSDFSARKDEAFERGYLAGRYGGVPILAGRLMPESECLDG